MHGEEAMISLVWWLRLVGVLYLVHFVAMVIARAPIRTYAPPGTLNAAATSPLSKFLVDTWVVFGLENAALGIALLVASTVPEQARFLAWTVIGIECARGIAADVYFLFRGYARTPTLVWIAVHAAVIVSGVLALRTAS
jgi:hypothetical protein